MDALNDFSIEVTRWLQVNYPQWEAVLQFTSELGREEFYLALLPLVYWCLDKRLGKHLTFVILAANMVSYSTKHFFRFPRPYWIDSSIGLNTGETYGLPSGHTLVTMVLYGFLWGWFRRGWLLWLTVFMVVLMGLSRVYLGVHFVHDVIAGGLAGLAILLGYYLWRRYQAPQFERLILGRKLLWVVLASLASGLVYAVVLLLLGEPDTAVPWAAFIPEAEEEEVERVVTSIAAILGFGIGIPLEASRVHFKVDGPIWQRALRYLVGMLITAAIWLGLEIVFPKEPVILGLFFRFIRYGLAALWMSYYGPAAFVRLRLAGARAEPDSTLKL